MKSHKRPRQSARTAAGVLGTRCGGLVSMSLRDIGEDDIGKVTLSQLIQVAIADALIADHARHYGHRPSKTEVHSYCAFAEALAHETHDSLLLSIARQIRTCRQAPDALLNAAQNMGRWSRAAQKADLRASAAAVIQKAAEFGSSSSSSRVEVESHTVRVNGEIQVAESGAGLESRRDLSGPRGI